MQAIIFDIDGTLLRSNDDDDRLYRRAVEHILGRVTFRHNIHDYDHVSDTGILTQVFSDNGIALDETAIAGIKNEFFRSVQEHIDVHGPFPEIPGAKDFLQRISDSPDHAFAIATGGWRQSAKVKLHAAGMAYQSVPLATSDDAVDRSDIMMHALQALDENFDSVTYYGDGPWDRAASMELGWSFVGVGSMIDGITSFDEQHLSSS